VTRTRFERLRGERGLGMIELLAAMALLSIAIAALLAAFASSVLSISRTGTEGTALTVADRQLEVYRTLPFACIALNSGTAASGCPAKTGFPNPYSATQTPTASDTPDHRTYTVTTTISYATADNLQKQVVVSVTNSAGTELAREASLFSSVGFPTAP
jgi:type II secretory pathway pseudopilin PulG